MKGIGDIKGNLMKLDIGTRAKINDALNRTIAVAETRAKHTAPWRDRTGNARNSIRGTGPSVSGETMEAALAIGVSYGKFLELSNGGRFRVIWPTIESVRPDLIKNLSGVLSL